MGTRALQLSQGWKRFSGRVEVLRGVDLAVDRGESLVILGRSGCGKSTLLRVLAGLEALDSGTVEWAPEPGGDTDGVATRIGVVFQDPLLLPWLTVRENVCLGGRFSATSAAFDVAYADELLTHFGLGSLAGSYPTELSGGQAQRVGIIRAAAIRPQALLLDEPFSALDPAIRADLQAWLAQLSRELGCTTIVVTHDVDEAITLGDRVALLGAEGRVRREWNCTVVGDEHGRVREQILGEYRDESRADLATAS